MFDHFHGQCFGESCVETFQLTDDALFEDSVDDYDHERFRFDRLPDAQFDEVSDLTAAFPRQLLEESREVFGCPDCTDGGGLFVQYSKDGKLWEWRFDQTKQNVPAYLHDFMDEVNEAISRLQD